MSTLFNRLESLLLPQPAPELYDPMAWFNELEAHSDYFLMDETSTIQIS